jgi:hypothetical protein
MIYFSNCDYRFIRRTYSRGLGFSFPHAVENAHVLPNGSGRMLIANLRSKRRLSARGCQNESKGTPDISSSTYRALP